MASHLFDRPLFVKRTHVIQEIGCLEDIFDFLDEWPEEKQDLTYQFCISSRPCPDGDIANSSMPSQPLNGSASMQIRVKAL